MDEDTANVLISLVDCLEGGGPFSGLWDQTVDHMEVLGYTTDEIETAMKSLYEIAGRER